jgi:hypothetical protein
VIKSGSLPERIIANQPTVRECRRCGRDSERMLPEDELAKLEKSEHRVNYKFL